jgi:hypothetical protein
MSQENVEIAKRFVDAFNRRDLNALMDAAVDTPVGGVVVIRDGKVSCARSYLDHGEALRAAGLTE